MSINKINPGSKPKLTLWKYLSMNTPWLRVIAIVVLISGVFVCFKYPEEFYNPNYAPYVGSLFCLFLAVLVGKTIHDFIKKRDDGF